MNHCRGHAWPESILAVLLAAVLLAFAGSYPASAQFVCTTTATDVTCNNSGTAASEANFDLSKNVTTTNYRHGDDLDVLNDGEQRQRHDNQLRLGRHRHQRHFGNQRQCHRDEPRLGRRFVRRDSSQRKRNIVQRWNDRRPLQHAQRIRGMASSVNHGSVGAIQVTSVFGNATSTNFGTAGSLSTIAPNGGTATTVNMGSVATSITTQTVDGNATTINSGSVGTSVSNFSANTGIATVINTGSIGTNPAEFGDWRQCRDDELRIGRRQHDDAVRLQRRCDCDKRRIRRRRYRGDLGVPQRDRDKLRIGRWHNHKRAERRRRDGDQFWHRVRNGSILRRHGADAHQCRRHQQSRRHRNPVLRPRRHDADTAAGLVHCRRH